MLTSAGDPRDATLTVRLVRSFEYRTIKNHVFRHVDLTTCTPARLIADVREVVATAGGFRPYRTVDFNAAKVYSHAHLTKTQNLSINLDHDEDPHWFVSHASDTPLSELGVMNETEISVFNEEAYEQFRANPVQKWE